MQALIYDVNPAGWAACKLLGRFWPAVRTGPLSGLKLTETEPPPLPAPDWVRVRTRLAGLCGTDLAILAQKQPPDSILQAFTTLPLTLGHENLAEVVEVGREADAAWLGRRVVVEPTLCCRPRGIDPPCPRCAAGEFGACENFAADGQGRSALPPGTSIGYCGPTGGGYGEQFVAHVSQLVPVPESVPDEQAVLTDPLACSLHAAKRADLSSARRVLVYGAGVLGLGLVAVLRALGFDGEIHALARSRHLRELAERLGAKALAPPAEKAGRFAMIAEQTGATVQRARFGNYMLSGGYDAVFDCAGVPRSINESLKFTAARGQVVLVGTGHGGAVDLTPLWFRELHVIGAYGRQFEHHDGRRVSTYELVLELMRDGRLDGVKAMLTHRFALGDYRQALTAALNKGQYRAVKIAFDYRRGQPGPPTGPESPA